MIRQVVRALVIPSIGIIVAGCAAPITPAPNLGNLFKCQIELCEQCTKTPPAQAAGDVWVILHLMLAQGMDDYPTRDLQYVEKWEWQLAKTLDAAFDYWMPNNMPDKIYEYFGRAGKVTAIWEKHQIHLRLLLVESCKYQSEDLRLDGRPRESMFTPESGVPWAPQLFRSINRLFTISEPNVIHVLLWWSLQEDDVDQVTVRGYARSAAHGGPAVWADAYGCRKLEGVSDGRCALLLAHEIGHALGLQHVDDKSNLMHPWYIADGLNEQQEKLARQEARQQFVRKK